MLSTCDMGPGWSTSSTEDSQLLYCRCHRQLHHLQRMGEQSTDCLGLQPLDDGNIFNAVYNRFTWANGYMWSYNTLIHVSNLEAHLPNNEVAIIQAFEDAGAQVLQHLPQQALGKVLEFLNSLDTLRFSTRRNLRLNRVSFWGVKDGSKMRGRSTHAQHLVSYMQDSASLNTYAEEVNAWRTAFNNCEMDYAMEEDQGGD